MTGPAEYRAPFTSTVGGVMTEEAGAITGDLEVLCRHARDVTHVAVRYTGADEWYTVTGSPIRARSEGAGETRDRLLEHLTTPGPVVSGNEKPVTLEGFSAA